MFLVLRGADYSSRDYRRAQWQAKRRAVAGDRLRDAGEPTCTSIPTAILRRGSEIQSATLALRCFGRLSSGSIHSIIARYRGASSPVPGKRRRRHGIHFGDNILEDSALPPLPYGGGATGGGHASGGGRLDAGAADGGRVH